MALKQSDVDFFRPMWRRVVLTAAVSAWCGYEVFVSRDQMWITITAIAVAYCVWNFFLKYPQDPPGNPPPGNSPPGNTPPGSTGGGTPPAA